MITRAAVTPTGARAPWRGIITEMRHRSSVTAGMTPVTLQEGGTPLLPAPVLSRRTPRDVYLKVEGMNPTGSFKDRGMTTAITGRRAGREGGDLRFDGETPSAARRGLRGAGRVTCWSLCPGQDRARKTVAGAVHGARPLQVDGTSTTPSIWCGISSVDYPWSLSTR